MKKLYKIKKGRKICGVCNGISEYLDIDVTVIRVLWIIFAFLGGLGLLAYIVCAFIMPSYPVDENVNGYKCDKNEDKGI